MKLLISGINNLTDARYFAALGADYLHFDVDDDGLSVAGFKEIIGWIEGPEFLVHASIHEALDLTQFSGIVGTLQDDVIEINQEVFRLCSHAESRLPEEEFWMVSSPQDLASLEEGAAPRGLAIFASGESEVGVKDFGFFDELIELLEHKGFR